MAYLLLAATLSAAPVEVAKYTCSTQAAETIASQLQTGSLLFSRGDCLAVRVYTQSAYTHVAAVVVEDGRPYVYDSTNGAGVRRLSLPKYLDDQCPNVVSVFQPARPFGRRQIGQLRQHLESQQGRPYAIKHHLTGQRSDGLHCSEYVTDALIACHLLKANQPSRVSPASLLEGVLTHELYTTGLTVELEEPEPVPPKEATWCERTWFSTKVCSSDCWVKMKGWFLCK